MCNLIHTKDYNFIFVLLSLQLATEIGDEGNQTVDNERLPSLGNTQEQASYHRQCSLLRKAAGIGWASCRDFSGSVMNPSVIHFLSLQSLRQVSNWATSSGVAASCILAVQSSTVLNVDCTERRWRWVLCLSAYSLTVFSCVTEERWQGREETVQRSCVQTLCVSAEATLPEWKIQVECKLFTHLGSTLKLTLHSQACGHAFAMHTFPVRHDANTYSWCGVLIRPKYIELECTGPVSSVGRAWDS